MKKKPIYIVTCTTKYSFGLQAVKASNKKEARKKFKKRFKKQRVIDIDKDHGNYSSTLIDSAI